ncbi:MAG TPA: F0F1-ATPase subunit [Lachnospiraceae bacterium]|nr:F0F1-ATPase subunit [Lachnospiraceae bacterium]
MRALMMIFQFGLNMLVPIVLCTLAGIFIDRKLGTSFMTIVLFFAGALAGFTNIYRMAKKIYDDTNSEDK